MIYCFSRFSQTAKKIFEYKVKACPVNAGFYIAFWHNLHLQQFWLQFWDIRRRLRRRSKACTCMQALCLCSCPTAPKQRKSDCCQFVGTRSLLKRFEQKLYRNMKVLVSVHWLAYRHAKWPSDCSEFQPGGMSICFFSILDYSGSMK